MKLPQISDKQWCIIAVATALIGLAAYLNYGFSLRILFIWFTSLLILVSKTDFGKTAINRSVAYLFKKSE